MVEVNSIAQRMGETMSSLEIAEVTGKNHQHVLRDIDELLKQGVDASNFGLTSYTDKSNRKQRCYDLTGKGVLLLASGYNPLLREKIINRWEELETGKQQPRFAHQPAQTTGQVLTAKMKVASWAIKTLNMSEASKLAIVKSIADPLGLPTPDYVESKGAHLSAKDLLAKHGAGISSVKFNETLVKLGYLTTVTRKAAGGKDKTFKVITDKGAQYGENMVSPHNQAETQPHWYIDKFGELLETVKKAISGGEEVSHD